MVASPWFLARCKQQPFCSSTKFGNLLIQFNKICSKAKFEHVHKDLKMNPTTPTHSIQFWVKQENVMKVKTLVAKHLPIFLLTSTSAKFPKDASDSTNLQSTYYDNPSTLECYESRLKAIDGATSIRFRRFQNSYSFYFHPFNEIPVNSFSPLCHYRY